MVQQKKMQLQLGKCTIMDHLTITHTQIVGHVVTQLPLPFHLPSV